VRSRQALLAARQLAPQAALPITQHGTTFNLAQVVRWLDSQHFAVGRWDGTMSIFSFQTAPFVGPLVTAAVNTPSSRGVQMITRLAGGCLATSHDSGSILLWARDYSGWDSLRLRATVAYDSTLGVATSGAWFNTGSTVSTLVVGHDSGFISLWSFDASRRRLSLLRSIDLRNPDPVNPFGSHVMYGMCPLAPSPVGSQAVVICGSDARLDVLAGPLRRLRADDSAAPLSGFRAARLVAGRDGVPSLGEDPAQATDALLAQLS
jgi:hypothetical protein